MMLGNQARLQRSVIINNLVLSRQCSDHTPPAIVARMKEYNGQAIPTEMMVGIEKMESTIVLAGSVAAARMSLGAGFTGLIDIVVTDIGLIGDDGDKYTHTYVYAAKVKSITPQTDGDGAEGAEVALSVHSYEFKFNGVTVDEIDSRTGKVLLGGNLVVPAVV